MSADPATLTAIASIIGAGSAAGSAMGLFGDSGPSQPKTPEVSAPTVMPQPDDEAAKKAKLRLSQRAQATRGRQSTVLSDDATADLLGG